MSSKRLEQLHQSTQGDRKIPDDNQLDCEHENYCEHFHKSKAEAQALVMTLENIDNGRCHLGSQDPLPAPLAEGTTMETLRARHWKFTQEHRASDLYLDIMAIFRDFILKQSSLEVTNCIYLGLGSLSGRDMYEFVDQAGHSLSQLVAFEGMIDLLMTKHHIQNVYFQEPRFNSLDKAFLKSLSFNIIDSPECIQHMTEQTFLFTPYCKKSMVNACLNKAFPAMLLGRKITDQSRWFFSPETVPKQYIDFQYRLPAAYPLARGLYHSYLEKRAVIHMPFSTTPSPGEARRLCEGELYVTCDEPEEYRFREDFFEFREKELFTRKQANAVWRSKGLTPWDASRWDNFVWFLTVAIDKVLPNCLRNLVRQYCPKLIEALPSKIWKTMPPFPEEFDKDNDEEKEVDEEEKKNR